MAEGFIADCLCRDLGIEREHLNNLMAIPDQQYKTFTLSGRRIDAPKLDLKYVQSWILDFVRTETPEVSDCVNAYEKNRGIVYNASMHREHKHLLTMDIRCFFKRCTSDKVKEFFQSMQICKDGTRLPLEDVDVLTSLSTYRGSLPMGSPCSPAIANRLMLTVDDELRQSYGPGLTYSRYSDDICISSNSWIDARLVVNQTRKVLHLHGFDLNEEKVRCMGRGDARRITGVYIGNDGELSIGSKRKRELNACLYRFLMYDEGDPLMIRGLLEFARSVNPRYVASILLKYERYGRATSCGGVMSALKSAVN